MLVTEWITRLLAGLLGKAARVLPPSRRQWAEALQGEAARVPAGWGRLRWLAGGLPLVAKEAKVARRLAYWMGLGVVAAAAAWAVWLSWRTAPSADPESMTDRVRVLVGASAFLVLPWVRRRSSVFGPVGSDMTSRIVRVAGCGAVCGLGLSIVRTDRNAGIGGVIGSGTVSWPREIAGLLLLGAVAAIPVVIAALRPRADAVIAWTAAGLAAAAAAAFVPLQALTLLYLAGILAATSRQSRVPRMVLAAGALAGLAAALIMCGELLARPGAGLTERQSLTVFLILSVVAFGVPAATAGLAAARLLPGLADPAQPRAPRVRQGLLAGLIAGAAGGLLVTAIFAGLGFMMIIGPLAGAAGGTLGGAFTPAHPRKWRPGGFQAAGTSASGL